MIHTVLMLYILCLIFFFFKQKTAYEMRISDWSSDVCSSDLIGVEEAFRQRPHPHPHGLDRMPYARAAARDHRAGHQPVFAPGQCHQAGPGVVAVDRLLEPDAVAVQHLVDRKSTRLNSSH